MVLNTTINTRPHIILNTDSLDVRENLLSLLSLAEFCAYDMWTISFLNGFIYTVRWTMTYNWECTLQGRFRGYCVHSLRTSTTRPDKHGRIFLVPVKSDLSSVHSCTRVHWTSNFYLGTRNTLQCLTGHPVVNNTWIRSTWWRRGLTVSRSS